MITVEARVHNRGNDLDLLVVAMVSISVVVALPILVGDSMICFKPLILTIISDFFNWSVVIWSEIVVV